MALIKCYECEKEISDKATLLIHGLESPETSPPSVASNHTQLPALFHSSGGVTSEMFFDSDLLPHTSSWT
jgi:hypothetical protein